LPGINSLYVAGNGDPFYSKYYREIIFEKYEGEMLQLQTNGLLFTEENWSKLRGRFKTLALDVSIDAMHEDTYHYLRRGGNFTRLMANMELAGQLRKSGEISRLRITFVVQASNFREMESFIDYGFRLGVDIVHFSPISNWTMQTEEEYTKINLLDERNEYHNEFLEIINKPVFRNSAVTFGFALRPLKQQE